MTADEWREYMEAAVRASAVGDQVESAWADDLIVALEEIACCWDDLSPGWRED